MTLDQAERDESFKIHWLRAEFVNKDTEKQYLNSRHSSDQLHCIIASLIIAGLSLLAIPVDYAFIYQQFPETNSRLLPGNLVAAVVFGLLSLLIWKSSDLRYLGYLFMGALLKVGTFYSFGIVTYLETIDTTFNPIAYVGLVAMVVLLYPIPLTQAVMAVIIVFKNALITYKYILE